MKLQIQTVMILNHIRFKQKLVTLPVSKPEQRSDYYTRIP